MSVCAAVLAASGAREGGVDLRDRAAIAGEQGAGRGDRVDERVHRKRLHRGVRVTVQRGAHRERLDVGDLRHEAELMSGRRIGAGQRRDTGGVDVAGHLHDRVGR